MPYLESSWTTVFWAKLRKAAQKFIHTEGFQLLRSFWRGPRRRQKTGSDGEGGGRRGRWTATLGTGSAVLALGV